MIEDFEGISDGVAVTTSNSNFTLSPVSTAGGTGLAETDGGGALSGSSTYLRCTQPNTAYWSIGWSGSEVADQWATFFIRPDSIPGTNCCVLRGYTGTTTMLSEALRAVNDTTLKFAIRDNFTTRWTSTTIAVQEWHRVAVHLDPANDECRLKIYSGANLLGTTASQDSGVQTLTGVSATTLNAWRIGPLNGMTTGTWQVDFDEVHVGESSEWFPPDPVVTAYDKHVVIG